MMGPSNLATPPRLIGRYLVFGEIASGGMATVHYGRLTGSVGFARTVAIKRLHPQFAKDPEFVTMFLDEARLVGRIRHPNVVPTLDVVATDGEIFLAMEYVQGESLSKLLKMARQKRVPVPPRIVATIMTNVLHGLHAAHEAKDEQGRALGIVHRDVSPQNVLVGSDGVARVLDFGVAKAAGRLQTTRDGQIKGKISYMPPEQLSNGGGVSRQTDIYAAAVVLWEALTGERLFDGENEAMTLVKVLEGRVEPPSRWVPDLPPGSDEVVLRGISKDPSMRFQTAREMAIAIERTIGLASPAAVGEWVEHVAADTLAVRARIVQEVEHASIGASAESLARMIPAPVSSSAVVVRPTEQPSSQVSSISVARNAARTSMPSPARSGSRGIVAGIFGIVVLAGMATGGVFLAKKFSAAQAQRAPVDAHVEPRTLEIADLGRSGPGNAVAPGQAAPSASTAPSAVASAAPSSQSAPPAPGAPAQPIRRPVGFTQPATPRPAAQPAPDCNPPYTIDPVTGHKKYKKNCD
jgi:serine/threonine-protein kinase